MSDPSYIDTIETDVCRLARLLRTIGRSRAADTLDAVALELFQTRDHAATPSAIKLRRSESEVLELLALGMTNKEIALRRGGSWRTVRNHVHALFKIFNATTRSELAVAAFRCGLVPATWERNTWV